MLRARMAALHGKEDSLLDVGRFDKLLRQANDAEIADVRMVGEGQFEISPHKADLAMQMQRRPQLVAETPADGSPPTARPPAALRFRGGSRTGSRPSEVQMVGVIDFSSEPPPAAGETEPAPPAAEPPVAEAPAASSVEVAGPPAGETPDAPRPAKRAPRERKAPVAAEPAITPPAVAAKAVPKAKSARGKKTSTRRTSKPQES